MSKKELLRKTNWTRKDISQYFDLSIPQVRYAIRKADIKPLKVNARKYAIEEILKCFGTSFEREIQKN